MLSFSFFSAYESFVEQSVSNYHGWGVAWYEGSVPHVFKEPIALCKSSQAASIIKNRVFSSIVIAHVRFTTNGGSRYENTHRIALTFA